MVVAYELNCRKSPERIADMPDEHNCLLPRYWMGHSDTEVLDLAVSWLQFVEDMRLCGHDSPQLKNIQELAGHYWVLAAAVVEKELRRAEGQ